MSTPVRRGAEGSHVLRGQQAVLEVQPRSEAGCALGGQGEEQRRAGGCSANRMPPDFDGGHISATPRRCSAAPSAFEADLDAELAVLGVVKRAERWRAQV